VSLSGLGADSTAFSTNRKSTSDETKTQNKMKRKPHQDASSTLEIEIMLSSILLLLPLIVNPCSTQIHSPLWEVTSPPALGPRLSIVNEM